MTNLQEIITSLGAKYVIIIENDLHFEEDNNKILAKYITFSEFRRGRLGESLSRLDLTTQFAKLEEFRIGFMALDHSEHQEALLPDDLNEYLTMVNGVDLLKPELNIAIDELKQAEFANEALLRNGIYNFIDDRYNTLLTALTNIQGLEVTFYRSMPVPANLEIFEEELVDGISKTNSVYYLAIVDKMLGAGADESGKRFIQHDLTLVNEKNNLKSLAFLFTSQPNDSQPLDFNSYFIREVEKGNADVLINVAKYLTDIAYASLFKSFADDFNKSSKDALNIALRNQHNVRHIISKSINEGISAFDNLKLWFELIMQKKFDDFQLTEMPYYSSFTRFFDIEKLQNHSAFSELGVEMEQLNSFELFDYRVNEKGLPIFPGDIFKKNGNFYILVGQVCDLLIRDSGSRGAKIAELLKINVAAFPDGKSEKFSINVDPNGTKTVNIQHFFDGEKFAVAKIDITSKNTYLGDFKAIDLCSFNVDGVSKVTAANADQYSLLHWINTHKLNYIKQLHKYFVESKTLLIGAKEIIDHDVIIFSSTDIEEDDDFLNFSFSRVGRLKGRFYDSLYQQVLNYKGRIDLNLIDQAVETSIEIELTVRYNYSDIEETVSVKLTRIKSIKEFVESIELVGKLSDQFSTTINNYKNFELGKKDQEYIFSKAAEDSEKYLLLLPLTYTEKNKKLKKLSDVFVKFPRLFDISLGDYSFVYIDTDEEGVLNEEKQIMISDIKRGLKFKENKITLTIEHGSIRAVSE